MALKQILLYAALACSMAASATPVLNWLQPTHDFGAFREEMGPVTCTFQAVNTGDEPVVVLDARANCGCTRPTYTKAPVAPGDTLKVSVSYDPKGRPGRFHKQVRVSTNSPAGASILNIRGTVIGASNTLRSRYPIEVGNARLSNDVTPFGETRKGRVVAAAVNIYNPTDSAITPSVANIPAYINGIFRPLTIPSGEQGILSLTAYTDRCPQWGVVTDSLTLIPDSRHPELQAQIATVIIINEDFSGLTPEQMEKAPVAQYSTDILDFDRINPVDGNIKRTFTITNTGQTPLLIRRAYTPDAAVTVTTGSTKIKPGHKTTVTATVNPAMIPAGTPLNARITIITNSPSNPTAIIRAVGTVTN